MAWLIDSVKKYLYPEGLWVAGALVAAGLGWLLVRQGATPNGRAAVENALRHATPADLESITVYPLIAGRGPRPARPFQVRAPAQLRALLPGLQQLRPLTVGVGAGGAFQPLLEATLVVRLAAAPAEAWHLHSRSIIFRLAIARQGEVVQLAQTNYFYQSAALSYQLGRLRDSLAQR